VVNLIFLLLKDNALFSFWHFIWIFPLEIVGYVLLFGGMTKLLDWWFEREKKDLNFQEYMSGDGTWNRCHTSSYDWKLCLKLKSTYTYQYYFGINTTGDWGFYRCKK